MHNKGVPVLERNLFTILLCVLRKSLEVNYLWTKYEVSIDFMRNFFDISKIGLSSISIFLLVPKVK